MESGKLVLLSFYDIECAGVGGGGGAAPPQVGVSYRLSGGWDKTAKHSQHGILTPLKKENGEIDGYR
jgi:hypothetical protein